jgi:hypothetical protein
MINKPLFISSLISDGGLKKLFLIHSVSNKTSNIDKSLCTASVKPLKTVVAIFGFAYTQR